MSGAQDQLEIKFRLTDGSDIGPRNFPVGASIATLKENIIAQWPRGRRIYRVSFMLSFLDLCCCDAVPRG